MPPLYDTVIRGSQVIDGTGSPAIAADVAIQDGFIVKIGDLSGVQGRNELAADGLTLAPGFIDAHTHDDRELLSNGAMTPKVSQGVTTVIGGNCGISLAPMAAGLTAAPVPPLDLLDATGDWYRFKTFRAYLAALQEQPAATNCAMLVGHTNLRVLEVSDLSRPASGPEVLRMRAHVQEALEAGAIGASTGLAYAPAMAASTEEVIEVCRPLTAAQGLYCTHMRDEGDHIVDALSETFRVGKELGVPVVISHHKLVGAANHGRSVQTLDIIRQQMKAQAICLDCYPYNASSTVLTQTLVANAATTLVTWSKPYPQYSGRDIKDIARELECSVAEAVDRLQPAGAAYFRMDDGDVNRILAFEPTMIGSDGLPHDQTPHPRLWGTFARVLGHHSRSLKLFSFEAAVHKMTGLTASRFGLKNRGVIREGAHADLVLLNAETVIDRATFKEPTRPPIGIHTVWTNGVPVWEAGRTTGKRPGQVLRRS
ncbi:D-aminoacylase [Bordetella avium]|uniref:N-acyl-D-amino-acid deacylase family protein n=1 Tax=Bordetella avium TaxID=521 RepID=UPI000FDA62A2|nr:D-aminoacylase [Bordetella avium]AZY48467.1 D-aminoacylase [Bordetella avium]